jgi:hypothetical protein
MVYSHFLNSIAGIQNIRLEVPMMEDRTTRQLLADILGLLKPVSELSQEIVTRADLQSYTEDLYNQLVSVAYEGMDFLRNIELGQVISSEWLIKRDELLNRAERLLLDAPNAQWP